MKLGEICSQCVLCFFLILLMWTGITYVTQNIQYTRAKQVHDELVFEVHKDDLDAVAKKVHELMENSTTLAVPLLVEVGSGENWDQAH